MIEVELLPPYRVGGKPASYQAVWFLARLYYAYHHEESPLPAVALRLKFTNTRNIRMLVSRAFADFAAWGVEVGWGRKVAPITELRLTQRSRGPFWLSALSARALLVTGRHGEADAAEMRAFLDIPSEGAESPLGVDYLSVLMGDLSFWQKMAIAMRDEHDGLGKQAGCQVAESYAIARDCAGNDFQLALALFKESQAWRRGAQFENGRRTLSDLSRLLERGSFSEAQPTFAAMGYVVKAWEAYDRGEATAALSMIGHVEHSPELQPVYRYNPRVRFECLNLRALLHKHAAMAGGAEAGEQGRLARAALQALSAALEAAFEAESTDAVQRVAANIGWCLWLFRAAGLVGGEVAVNEVQLQALRWLSVSEWICDRFGLGGSTPWNAIFMLRIVRGHCTAPPGASLSVFRRQQPLGMAAVQAALKSFRFPYSPGKGCRSWAEVACVALEEHDEQRVLLTQLQLANLLLEAIWFTILESGDCPLAHGLVDRLRAMLPSLRGAERSFFADSVARLPSVFQHQES